MFIEALIMVRVGPLIGATASGAIFGGAFGALGVMIIGHWTDHDLTSDEVVKKYWIAPTVTCGLGLLIGVIAASRGDM